MLPETLSNGICSLMPKVDRMCFVCDMQVGGDGEVTGSRFYEAVMNSHARLTYNQVWKAVGEGDADTKAFIGPLLPQVQRLHQLYHVLSKARTHRGAINSKPPKCASCSTIPARSPRPACWCATMRTS